MTFCNNSTIPAAVSRSNLTATFTIEPPETQGGLPPDFPQYPGITNLNSFGGVSSFSAPDDPETVAGFYTAELAAQGWSIVSDSSMSGMFMQEWSKGDVSLTLTIVADDTGSSVTVIVEEP